METAPKCLLICLAVFLWVEIVKGSRISLTEQNGVKIAVFLSPSFELLQGSVAVKYYPDVGFPRGHVALKSFSAEIVDDKGISIPLYETYIHHWVVVRYYQRKGSQVPKDLQGNINFDNSDFIAVKNKGLCDDSLYQYFGLGSETRKTSTYVPDPYGIQVGNPADIPTGYEEKWLLNVHAIDTREVVDKLRCRECWCDLYNVTVDIKDYIGGLRCCYDNARCKVKEGVQDVKRRLFLKYTVKYIEWHAAIAPVDIYVLDVTDRHECLIEYQVDLCSGPIRKDGCINTKSVQLVLPEGGDVIYGVAHLHTGGINSTLYGKDGRVICSSNTITGNGTEAGNEAGYVVGMSTCYPMPGTIQISKGETITLVSNYNNMKRHAGVMGLFYFLVAHSNSSAKPISLEPLGVHRKM